MKAALSTSLGAKREARPPRRCRGLSFVVSRFILLLFFYLHRRVITSDASACIAPLFPVLWLASRATTPCDRSRPSGRTRPHSLLPVIPWAAGAFPNRDYVAKHRHTVSHPQIPRVCEAVHFFLPWIPWVHGAFTDSSVELSEPAGTIRSYRPASARDQNARPYWIMLGRILLVACSKSSLRPERQCSLDDLEGVEILCKQVNAPAVPVWNEEYQISKNLHASHKAFCHSCYLLNSAGSFATILQACSLGPQCYQIRQVKAATKLVRLLHLTPDDLLEFLPVERTILIARRLPSV